MKKMYIVSEVLECICTPSENEESKSNQTELKQSMG